MKKEVIEAKREFEKIRQLISKARSPYRDLTKQEIIEQIRRARERLWEGKLAARS